MSQRSTFPGSCLQTNFLKLNSNKTKVLRVGWKSSVSKVNRLSLTIDNYSVSFSPRLKVWVSSLTTIYLLNHTSIISPGLLILPPIYYCNSLLSGLPNKSLYKIQLVQNAAARIITRTPPLTTSHLSYSNFTGYPSNIALNAKLIC